MIHNIFRLVIKYFFVVLATIGIFAAVCVVDGSQHEIAVRFVGIIVAVVSALIASAINVDNEEGGRHDA